MSLREKFHEYVAQTSDHSLGLEVVSARGSVLTLSDGRQMIDMTSGVCVLNMGHSLVPALDAAKSQMYKYTHTQVYGEHIQQPQVEYAQWICERAPVIENPQVFFLNSGNEAIDLCLKMSRKLTGRKGVVALSKGFHGRGYGAMQVTWGLNSRGFFADQEDTVWLDPDLNLTSRLLEEVLTTLHPAAVVLEVVRGEAGALEVPNDFLNEVQSLANRIVTGKQIGRAHV